MEFELLGESLELSEGRKNLMTVQVDFENMAREAKRDFGAYFANIVRAADNSGSMMEYMQKIHNHNEFMDRFIRGYVSKARAYMTKYNVYSITDDNILKELYGYPPVSALQMKFESAISDFLNECYFRGNGDGLRPMFVNRERELGETLYKDMMGLCEYVQKYLHDNAVIEIEFISGEDANKAAAYCLNLREGHIPESERKSAAIEMITLDPRKKEYYDLVFEQFPEAHYEIFAVAKHLGIDLTDKVIEDVDKRYDLSSITCEEEALAMREDIAKNIGGYGISHVDKQDALARIITDFDIRARTYEGVIYDTRELRRKAETDDDMLFILHGDVNKLEKDECRRLMAKIAEMDCTEEVKPKHLNFLYNRINTLDRDRLMGMLSGLEGATEPECGDMLREIERYEAPESMKAPYTARIRSRIMQIWEKEDFERFTRIYTFTPLGNEAAVNAARSEILRTGRTQTKLQFDAALERLTPENVEKAAKYAYSVERGGSGGIFGRGRQEIYEALTLNGRVIHPAIKSAVDAIRASKSPDQGSPNAGGVVFCAKCGTQLSSADKFCVKCGERQF